MNRYLYSSNWKRPIELTYEAIRLKASISEDYEWVYGDDIRTGRGAAFNWINIEAIDTVAHTNIRTVWSSDIFDILNTIQNNTCLRCNASWTGNIQICPVCGAI